MATVLFFVGLVIAGIGGIWLIITAFKESVLWGLAVWFVPLVALVFVALHWENAKKPFLVSVIGSAMWIGGALMGDPTTV